MNPATEKRADKCGPEQLELPLSREQKFALLAKFRAGNYVLISPTMVANLANLIEHVELCVGDVDGDGFKLIQRETLAGRLNVKIRSVTRWGAGAREIRVLQLKHA